MLNYSIELLTYRFGICTGDNPIDCIIIIILMVWEMRAVAYDQRGNFENEEISNIISWSAKAWCTNIWSMEKGPRECGTLRNGEEAFSMLYNYSDIWPKKVKN